MIRSDKKLKNLALILERNNPSYVMQAIEQLRDEEPFEGAVELLAGYYDANHGTVAGRAIESFMNDLKDKSLRPEVIAEVKKEREPETITMLVSSMWQSGLDYSEYTREIAEIFLKTDFITALECLSVIEESVLSLDRAAKDDIIKMVEEGQSAAEGSKRPLFPELISVLRR